MGSVGLSCIERPLWSTHLVYWQIIFRTSSNRMPALPCTSLLLLLLHLWVMPHSDANAQSGTRNGTIQLRMGQPQASSCHIQGSVRLSRSVGFESLKVRLWSPASGLALESPINNFGHFTFPEVPSGDYHLQVVGGGFRSPGPTVLQIAPGTRAVNIQLEEASDAPNAR
jgi:hypothetical protein